MQNLIKTYIDGINIGKMQSYKNLSVFPLVSDYALDLDYLTLDEALDGNAIDVVELDQEGSVPELKVVNKSDVPEDDAEAAMLAMLEGLPTEDDKASPDDINFGGATASRAEFQHLQEPVTPPDAHNIELLLDVDLPISIELGRTKLPISDIYLEAMRWKNILLEKLTIKQILSFNLKTF